MKRFIQGEHRGQGTLLPDSFDDYVSTKPVKAEAMDAALRPPDNHGK
ncbi:hypothetical protein PS934_01446 [Pseudomonas fluorescens]|nr:hypothetical protein [Pseudomonas fluorescens]VVP89127.1 hypothetical protein PS934_01446 [Pseudomonas fluorescens]